MESEQLTVPRRRKKHSFIERPRLLRSLDASKARVRMLIAPAGFGKTTLAEQWTRASASHVAWYPCRNASADVAALSVGIAAVAAEFIPGCEKRLRERLMVTQSPADEVDVLAEILAEDIAGWPTDAWLVVDDYQFLCRTVEAELFMELLVAAAPVNVLIASRRRPTWVSRRDVLYGDVLEVNQTELAMSRDEAELVLDVEPEQAGIASGLVAIANGWPAVIALAAVSGVPELPDDDAPEALYDFFAEEVYRALSPDDRAGLGVLAAATALDQALADILLGPGRAEQVVAEGVAIGVIVERGERLELHPLARTFIEAKAIEEWPAEHATAVASCLEVYRKRRDWDAAFDLVERNNLVDELESLLTEALDELLDTARLTTVEAWVQFAATRHMRRPIVSIAAAEVCLRMGQLIVAETLADDAIGQVESGDDFEFRAFKVAGQVAHVASRETQALKLFRQAEAVAQEPLSAREALWGQLMAMMALELPEASDLLGLLRSTLPLESPRERVRLADKQMVYGIRFGELDRIADARGVEQLLPYVSDPCVRSSFRSVYSCALALHAYYDDALRVAEDLVEDATTSRVDFGLAYAHSTSALALAGLARFSEAHAALDRSFEQARRCADAYGEQNVYAFRVRLHSQQGEFAQACAIEPPDVTDSLPGMRGEVLASRGLALACLGRLDDAEALAAAVDRTTSAVEATVLTAAIRLVVALKARQQNLPSLAGELVDTAFRCGGIDLLVTCYRASPDVLKLLVDLQSTRERVLYVVNRAGDAPLLEAVGHSPLDSLDPISTLSPREREIYEFVCLGSANRTIAQRLFISEATVKLHVHHIFDKLGVRSRHALALTAAGRRVAQAAPATGSDAEADASS